jgi:DNA-binding transcriptional regulator YdaS (Cro superfamily)
MDLNTYLLSQGKGAAAELASKLNVSPVLISQWRYGARQVPAERCPEIERATGGLVKCESLRPDVDWGYLRARVG